MLKIFIFLCPPTVTVIQTVFFSVNHLTRIGDLRPKFIRNVRNWVEHCFVRY